MVKPLWYGVDGARFVDTRGRHAILRGVNLGGDSKVPWPDGGTERPSDFSDHRTVSFVGRPFPLDEADEHLRRIRRWGFNVLRLLTSWEAVEHAGPGQYDEAYLDYFAALCRKAEAHGLAVFVDFHQDVWSRMSGGDGAPGWIFEALGLDFTRFGPADAAHVMQHRYDYSSPVARQEDRYPMMSWPSNYGLPVNGIMWTAFFAGRTLTPEWTVDGRNVQDFLQMHYLGALAAVAERVKGLPNVLGFDSLNEPGLGWVGRSLSGRRLRATPEDPMPVWPGLVVSPLDGLKIASGLPVTVPVAGGGEGETRALNPDGVRIWRDESPDPFERAGAWRRTADGGEAMDEEFFRSRDGRAFDHEADFMQPFFHRVAQTMRAIRPDWLLFAEVCPYILLQGRGFPSDMPARTVNANHWYDIEVLRTKTFDPDAPRAPVADRYAFQLGYLRAMGEGLGERGGPTLIGEFGIPYDLNDGEAFERWAAGERDPEVWRAHSAALELMYDAMDRLLLSSTQWNYTATNRNDLRIGDRWNQEDLSIFSVDQATAAENLASGARGFEGFCRPFVRLTQGRLESVALEGEVLSVVYQAEPAIDGPTEVFVPLHLYPRGVRVEAGGVTLRWSLDPDQVLRVRAEGPGRATLTLSPVGPEAR